MPDRLEVIGGVRVLACAADGEHVASARDAADLLGAAYGVEADWIVLPVERLSPDFFVLRTRVAGEVLGKFADYRMGLVVVGDISAWVEGSSALRDLVRECNRGRQAWFVGDMGEAERRLAVVGAALAKVEENGR
ncbi:DUF4180 domain-containing protein [Phytomonospora sp. NPDC050363]|uniref:DUF4180 domain-containing protein n=1 Tax=Phytomonospora sp. NPDC050363 TaxID=3155642 RepID=UPI0033D20CAD